ncbi:MAG TPA: class I adenylate-forming enzyme family protein [Myxococcales bacterium]|nr:class I adenylate-forming enzyme family protein [Myxococcales bacterium]
MTAILDEDMAARRAASVLARLAALGVHAGDRIAVLAGNGSAFVAARDAATAAGLVLAPINPRLAPAEIAWIVGHAKPRALLVDEAHRGPAPDGVPIVELDDALGPAMVLDHARIGATILYTSGTTGRPKGCWRTAEQERARADELRASYSIGPADTHLIVCPLAHSAPGIFLRAARAAGARTAIAARFTPEGFVEDVRRHRATVVFLVPTQVYRLLAIDPSPRLESLRAVIVAGAPFPPAQKAAFAAWLGPGRLYEFYGSSETGTVSVIGPAEHAAHPGSVGRPPPGVSVRVHDGELFVRSPAVMSGYLTGSGDAVAPLDARDGHISVGDLGTIDGDGFITLVDRKHDTIISGGFNVYPAEVERALAGLPEVAGAVVFGVADEEWGQIVAAVIALREPGSQDGASVRAALRGQLAGYKLPRAIAFCAPDELPIGSSGKALRRAARDAFAGRLARIA